MGNQSHDGRGQLMARTTEGWVFDVVFLEPSLRENCFQVQADDNSVHAERAGLKDGKNRQNQISSAAAPAFSSSTRNRKILLCSRAPDTEVSLCSGSESWNVPAGTKSIHQLSRTQFLLADAASGEIVRRSKLRCFRRLTAFLAPFAVPVLVITRDQNDSVEVSVGEQSAACNFSTVINGFAICHFEVGTWRNEIIQVNYGTAGLPQKPVHLESFLRAPRCAHDLTL